MSPEGRGSLRQMGGGDGWTACLRQGNSMHKAKKGESRNVLERKDQWRTERLTEGWAQTGTKL